MQRLYVSETVHLFIVLMLSIQSACTSPPTPFAGLPEKGILALSTRNPYLGTNLFIAREAEHSNVLYHFLENRGAPQAIELTKDDSSSPQLFMFYPGEKEVFSAIQSRALEDPLYGEWIVRGPFAMNRTDYKTLKSVFSRFPGEPVFMVKGKKHRFRSNPRQQLPQYLHAKIRPTPTPVPTKQKRRARVTTPTPHATPTSAVPQNFDQQALAVSKGHAFQDKNGDILHKVSKFDQTLQDIALWYTGDKSTAKKIAATNNIKPDEPLTLGQEIRVPATLVKKVKILE